MSLIENLDIVLLAIAMSLDAFAVMTIEGSMLRRINHFDLIKAGILFGSWQTVVVGLTNVITQQTITIVGNVNHIAVERTLLLMAIAIFIFLGLFMIWKFSRSDPILESRKDRLNIKRVISLAAITSIDAFLIGIALGFLNVSVIGILIPFIIFSILAVFAGIHLGHWFGFEQKSTAYYISGIILIIFGIDLIFKLI